ncbi:MAG: quinol:cytochrome C oxidoreductase, partial [Flavobacteriaceae bacterium]
MYQFSGKLKMFSIALIILGALGIGLGFYNAPSTVEEAMEMVASSDHGDGHGAEASHGTASKEEHSSQTHTNKNHSESHHEVSKDTHVKGSHADESAHGDTHDDAHAEHVFHQLQNRPWSAVYVALLFFLGVSLLVLAFYASQRVAQAGWSIVLFRVMEAISANLLPVSIIMLLIIISSALHSNHLFTWMGEGVFDKTSENFDPIVYGKRGWLNVPWWVIRSVIYLLIWNAYRFLIRKNSIKEDTANDGYKTYKKNYNMSVVFLFLFMITESMAVWDWIMGLDPHWFSTLFGWYVLATLLVSAITMIAFVTIYLRSKGYL